MGRALLGLLKGALIGGAIGYCLLKLGNPSGVLVYLCCGIVGAVVGLLCGRAPWNAETVWTPILKVLIGFGIGAGLYALGHRFAPAMSLSIQGFATPTSLRSGATLAPLIGFPDASTAMPLTRAVRVGRSANTIPLTTCPGVMPTRCASAMFVVPG